MRDEALSRAAAVGWGEYERGQCLPCGWPLGACAEPRDAGDQAGGSGPGGKRWAASNRKWSSPCKPHVPQLLPCRELTPTRLGHVS